MSAPRLLLTNRELSWLDFNSRVLKLAEDKELPLLERVRFLSIFHSNLDEFFMVRVASLLRLIELGYEKESNDSLSNRQVLHAISERVKSLVSAVEALFFEEILPGLHEQDIHLSHFDGLDLDEKEILNSFFDENIFPVLTPLTVDPSHPFPHISGLSLNFGIYVRSQSEGRQFVRLKIPPNLPRLLPLKGSQGTKFVWLEEVIAENLEKLFPGAAIEEYFLFRVTRNQDLEIDEDETNEDLLSVMQEELEKRRFGNVVRIEVENIQNENLLLQLIDQFETDNLQIYKVGAPLDLGALSELCNIDRAELKYPPFQPITHPHFAGVEDDDADAFFAKIREQETLLHHPYHSFSSSVGKFVELAAKDPKVLAIKQTLYRTSGDSPIMHSLIDAAKRGKQVLAVIEIRARFDETANVRWAQQLEEAGVHVVYGILGLKTHAKASLVVREENGILRRYSHIGTGNYHPRTARMYEDLGLLSADEVLGRDLSTLFNQLSGFAPEAEYVRLLVAPKFLRLEILEKIKREVDNHLSGKSSRIRMKLNSIVDPEIIAELYKAVDAGVPVEISVRGISCFDPRATQPYGKLKIRSYLGRFLEHSRVYNFHNDGNQEFWIGSADMMDRNLNRRIESLVQITDAEHMQYIERILDGMFSERYQAWILSSSNDWHFEKYTEERNLRLDFQQQYIKETTK